MTQGGAPPWRRLDPRMLVVHPVMELLKAVPALLGLLVAGTSSGSGPLWSLLGVGLVVVLGTMRWVTTTYRITPEQVLLRRGLVRRRLLSVPRDRVRTVDVTAHAIHRVMGLARVTVGTGRSDRSRDAGIRLDALSDTEAARLREELLHAKWAPAAVAHGAVVHGVASAVAPGVAAPGMAPAGAVPGVRNPGSYELARLRPGWLRYGPFTLSGIVTVGVLGAFLANVLNESHLDPSTFGPLRAVAAAAGRAPLGAVVAVAVVGLLLLVALASTVGYLLAFWRFRLTRHAGGTLHVTRGLVTKRATTLEERRLRGVEVSEPLLLRAVGGARCIAVATGLRVGRGAERGGSLLLPPAPRGEAARVAAAVLRAADAPSAVGAELTGHGPRARRRRLTRALIPAAAVIGLLAALGRWAWAPAWSWQVSLVLLPLAVLVGLDRARSLGHALVGAWLVTSWGSLVRRRVVLDTDGIIGWTVRRSLIQRRAGLATLTATTAAGRQGYRVVDVGLAEAVRVADAAVPGLLGPFLVPQHLSSPARVVLSGPVTAERA